MPTPDLEMAEETIVCVVEDVVRIDDSARNRQGQQLVVGHPHEAKIGMFVCGAYLIARVRDVFCDGGIADIRRRQKSFPNRHRSLAQFDPGFTCPDPQLAEFLDKSRKAVTR